MAILPRFNWTGKNLKVFRAALDLSQSELANELGIGQKAISDYESGQREIPKSMQMLLTALCLVVSKEDPEIAGYVDGLFKRSATD